MPLSVTRFGLRGKIATMAGGQVVDDGIVWINATSGKIEDVRRAGAGRPAGFQQARVINTAGTIFPGLIELHNHLAYNILPLWQVPEQYEHRDQWPNHPDYVKLIRGPMQTLGVAHADKYLAAIVRWVEAKCLAAGVTTSQGITLNDSKGLPSLLRGNVRNMELAGPPELRTARARIGDLKNGEADDFLKGLKTCKCLLLHLSEGARGNEHALSRFDRLLTASGDKWAITDALAGIHSAALRKQELEILKDNGGAIVWSPMSNLLLYGTTADVKEAKRLGIRIGIGSDWSPTGSKNLLGELKVARLFNQAEGNPFTDEEIVQMATSTAADILSWGGALGKIAAGFFADLLVVRGRQGDPYKRLLESAETDIVLVTIGGAPRYGRATVMKQLVTGSEARVTGGKQFAFDFEPNGTGQPITVAEAETLLTSGLKKLKTLAESAPDSGMSPGTLRGAAVPSDADGEVPQWTLDLSDDAEAGFLSAAGLMQAYRPVAVPVQLDPLTVAGDGSYFKSLRAQLDHVPDFIRKDLKTLY